jgi:hypothetical protein
LDHGGNNNPGEGKLASVSFFVAWYYSALLSHCTTMFFVLNFDLSCSF